MSAQKIICEADVESFTQGDCWLLALAINKLTGWDLRLVRVAVSSDDDEYVTTFWVHAVVQTPDGHYLDITGKHNKVDLITIWEEHLEDSLPEPECYLQSLSVQEFIGEMVDQEQRAEHTPEEIEALAQTVIGLYA